MGREKGTVSARCLVPSVYPLFSWLNSPLQDSSLAHGCLFVKNGKGLPSCVGQAVTARLRERTRRGGTGGGERRQEVPLSPPSFLVFLVRARRTEKASIAFTASITRL